MERRSRKMSVDRIDVSAAEKIINQMGLVFAGISS